MANKNGLFSDLLVGLISIIVLFAVVLFVASAIKERQCNLIYVDPFTDEVNTLTPGQYHILPIGFQFVNGSEWCYCTWDYLLVDDGVDSPIFKQVTITDIWK